MSTNYSAFQYDGSFKPKSLCNWEVPKFSCMLPKRQTGKTTIIANSRGHLLPGVFRPKCSPWGEYLGTWRYPRHVTREVADELNGLKTYKERMRRCKIQATLPPLENRKLDEIPNKIPTPKIEDKVIENKSSDTLNVKPEEQLQTKKVLCPIHDLYVDELQ